MGTLVRNVLDEKQKKKNQKLNKDGSDAQKKMQQRYRKYRRCDEQRIWTLEAQTQQCTDYRIPVPGSLNSPLQADQCFQSRSLGELVLDCQSVQGKAKQRRVWYVVNFVRKQVASQIQVYCESHSIQRVHHCLVKGEKPNHLNVKLSVKEYRNSGKFRECFPVPYNVTAQK